MLEKLICIDNAKSSIYYICVWMVCMPLKHVCRVPFIILKYSFLGLTLLSSDIAALSKTYLKLGLQIVR